MRRDIDGHAGGPKFIRTIRRYESGLSGDPSGLPLVRERLTVPLPAAGTSDAVNREVTRRLASFRPSRGASPITSLPPARFFIRLVFTIMLICFIIGACALTVGAARDLLGAPGANTAIALMLITVMSLATVGLTVLGIVIARHTWLMRTPQWLAEDQMAAPAQDTHGNRSPRSQDPPGHSTSSWGAGETSSLIRERTGRARPDSCRLARTGVARPGRGE